MPGGKKPGPSIKRPRVYEALRRWGYTKRAAAAISNSMSKARTSSRHRTSSGRRSAGSRKTKRNARRRR